MWNVGATRDAKDTRRTAMLLAEAMDRFQALFIDTVRSHLGSGPPLDYDDWERRRQEALERRQSATAVAAELESRTQPVIDHPRFRSSRNYLFYVASRQGLTRQFSAVDMISIANTLCWMAGEEDDAELAAAAAEDANELGQYALFLLQAAPTLRTDAASVRKLEVLSDPLEKSYEVAKRSMDQAVNAIERIAEASKDLP
jgi:hypothetical protein